MIICSLTLAPSALSLGFPLCLPKCFFSLSLPAYTSASALRAKLLYAMESCTSMDGDLVLKNSELYDYSADDVK